MNAADVDDAVLLGAHHAAVGERERLLGDLAGGAVAVARLAARDQPGVLGEPGGVQEERDAGDVAQCRRPAWRFSMDTGWPPPPLLVMVMRTRPTRCPSGPSGWPRERVEVDVALERLAAVEVARPRRHGRSRASHARSFDVGARGVEMRVGQDEVAALEQRREQHAFGGAPLVGRKDVRVAGQLGRRPRGSGRTSGSPRRTVARPCPRPPARRTSRRCPSRSAGRWSPSRRAGRTGCRQRRKRFLTLGACGDRDFLDNLDPVRRKGFHAAPLSCSRRDRRVGHASADRIGRPPRRGNVIGLG